MADCFVIVGSGIAGLSAAEAIRHRHSNARIVLVSEEKHPFYSRPGLAYYLRGDLPESQLSIRTPEAIRALYMERIDARAELLDAGRHILTLSTGQPLHYDRLLIATGALASTPPFPGADLNGVVKLDGLDDTRRILKGIRKRKTAIVVGGGITALELAEGLNARGMRVQFFLRGDRYWSDVLDPVESAIVMDRLRAEGIHIRTRTQIQEVRGRKGVVEEVVTQAGEVVPCAMVAVAIGVRPRLELAKSAGLAINKGILVDAHLRTSAANVFAAGDVTEVRDPTTGASALDVLWPTALAQGRIAGANMAGDCQAYVKSVPCNVTLLGGINVTILGAVGAGENPDLVTLTRGESEGWRGRASVDLFAQHNRTNRLRLLISQRQITGALVMGDQTWTRMLQAVITKAMDITPVRPAFLEGRPEALTQLNDLVERSRRIPPVGILVTPTGTNGS